MPGLPGVVDRAEVRRRAHGRQRIRSRYPSMPSIPGPRSTVARRGRDALLVSGAAEPHPRRTSATSMGGLSHASGAGRAIVTGPPSEVIRPMIRHVAPGTADRRLAAARPRRRDHPRRRELRPDDDADAARGRSDASHEPGRRRRSTDRHRRDDPAPDDPGPTTPARQPAPHDRPSPRPAALGAGDRHRAATRVHDRPHSTRPASRTWAAARHVTRRSTRSMTDVADGPAGLVAVGWILQDFRGATWQSTDGSMDIHGHLPRRDAPHRRRIRTAGDTSRSVGTARAPPRGRPPTASRGGGRRRPPAFAGTPLRLTSVVSWPGGFVAGGFRGQRLLLRRRGLLDVAGRHRVARVPDSPALDDARVVAIAVGGPGLVAVGEAGPADRPGPAVVWTSTDGVRWERVPDAPAFDGARMRSVASVPGIGLVAVGEDIAGDTGIVWTSRTGSGGAACRRRRASVVRASRCACTTSTADPTGVTVVGTVTEGTPVRRVRRLDVARRDHVVADGLVAGAAGHGDERRGPVATTASWRSGTAARLTPTRRPRGSARPRPAGSDRPRVRALDRVP